MNGDRHIGRARHWRRVGLLLAMVALPGAAGAVSVTTSATSADNEYWLYVDGGDGQGGTGQTAWAIHGSNWNVADTGSFNLALGARHAIAVKAINHAGTGTNPAAFLGQLDAGGGCWFAESGSRELLTGAHWEVWYGGTGSGQAPGAPGSTDPQPAADGASLDWWEQDYDTGEVTGWVAATEIATNGTPGTPWHNANGGPVAGISESAWWIWTDNWEGDGALTFDGQDVDSPVYLRLTFTPVPEPLTMLGVLGGVAGIGAYIRKRQGV